MWWGLLIHFRGKFWWRFFMGRCVRPGLVGWVLLSLVFSGLALADFTPPGDGKLTEKQVTTFIAVLKDQMDAIRAAGNAAAGTSGAAGVAIYSHAGEKIDASLSQHGMNKEEYDWVGKQVGDLWPIAMLREQWEETGKPDLEKQIKVKEDDLQAANEKLATYQKAEKEGTRVLTKEQRDAATQSAGGDVDSAKQTVADAAANVKQIGDEVSGHDKDVADDEALAKNPPGDVSADDRSAYIDGKKNDAQTARDAASDARTRLKEAQKSLDDAKGALGAAQGKVDHPEAAVTDDEKAQVKQEDDQAIADAKGTIEGDQQAIATMKETITAGPPTMGAKADPDNLALAQKHIKEYLAAIGASKALDNK
jgi:hypothetical protein